MLDTAESLFANLKSLCNAEKAATSPAANPQAECSDTTTIFIPSKALPIFAVVASQIYKLAVKGTLARHDQCCTEREEGLADIRLQLWQASMKSDKALICVFGNCLLQTIDVPCMESHHQ